jgi:hypothetical protein
MRIARAGKRIGIDLNPLNASSADDRRWLQALCFPEFREQQARLATALDVTARTDICLFKGDALDRLSQALAISHGPVCVFHSVCLLYWSGEARAALHRKLCEASHSRDIFRLGFELSEEFAAWHAGQGVQPAPGKRVPGMTFDITCTCYGAGTAESRIIAHTTPDFTSLNWLA